ncbi:Uu.00g011710.m01.CDS01 [Anthostomella pinea]|uniref:Uu.00g011710.m01.CDS01 n=1 Tax=Anthostomella pinea TaxID=933095 RepID=A0AAI8YMU2_9PEZI|nr:Uu.00g011710.m01.CDS01 [Anthostomella pinea]
MWGSDANARSYPRMFWVSSPDLQTWSDVVWGEPYGIDPHLFRDPISNKTYLTLMSLNNGYDRLWGIGQCEVGLSSGKCTGPFRSLWNGTMPVTNSTRPEGPKLFYKDDFYYLLIAEGGTGITHRASIARSQSPEGPWEASPTNPLIFNGADTNLTISSTGHATIADTPDGRWFATLLGRRNIKTWSPLGRETFFAPVTWEDGWPTMNYGEFLLPSQEYDFAPDQQPLTAFEDNFEGSELGLSWYQLRSPYTVNYKLGSTLARNQEGAGAGSGGVTLVPNVFTLSDHDTPAAILRKQISTNMTFSAALLPTSNGLGPYQSVGISAYVSAENHQDIGLRGCASVPGMCAFVDMTSDAAGPDTRPETHEVPLNITKVPSNFSLHISAQPLTYKLGYATLGSDITWLTEFSAALMNPGFDGSMFALFASGNGFAWPFDAPEVGFSHVREKYYKESFGDYIET